MVLRLPLYGRNPTEPLTVESVLDYPALRRGDPVVVAGAAGLARQVRWVHASDFLGVADLLHGGEILLTTGVMLSDDADALGTYVARLAAANAAALVIGLGPRFSEPLPAAMIAAADRAQLPLVALRRTIAFIDVTEEVHASLVDTQVRELQASESIHVIFSALAVQGSRPEIVLKQVAKLSGFAVVLENREQQILAFDPADRSRGDVLAEWAEHSQRRRESRRTFYDPQTGWLQTTVGARGNDWGRLILIVGSAGLRKVDGTLDPTMSIPRSLVMLLEQAASTLAIGRLVDRESELVDLSIHQGVLSRLLADPSDPDELDQQGSALGVSLRRSPVVALGVRPRDPGRTDPQGRRNSLRTLSGTVAEFLREQQLSALTAPADEFAVGVLVRLPGANAPRELAARLANALSGRGFEVILAVAGPTRGVVELRTALIEALETVATATGMGLPGPVVTSADLGVHGLIYSLRDDPRLRRFAERTLESLVRHDREHGTALVTLVRHFLQAGRNKTVAAQRAFVSRPWMHERLRLAGQVLGVDLEDEDVCLSLQLALAITELLPEMNQADERKSS